MEEMCISETKEREQQYLANEREGPLDDIKTPSAGLRTQEILTVEMLVSICQPHLHPQKALLPRDWHMELGTELDFPVGARWRKRAQWSCRGRGIQSTCFG